MPDIEVIDSQGDKARKDWLARRATSPKLARGRMRSMLYAHTDRSIDPKTGKPSPMVRVETAKGVEYLPMHVAKARANVDDNGA